MIFDCTSEKDFVHYTSVSYQPHLVKAGICNLLFFWDNSKFNDNIGKSASAPDAQTEWGFDFLGYHFGPEGLATAQKTLYNFVERAIRLYEQELGKPCGSTRLGEYVKRWRAWVHCGVYTRDLGHSPRTFTL